ncbi:MAG: ATP-binding protein [Chromatiaceae bacterium]|nr:MAG: ATP-binding protein [Chromatiaceae bacterium]
MPRGLRRLVAVGQNRTSLVVGILGWRFNAPGAGGAADWQRADQQQQARWRGLIEELQGPGAPPARLDRREGLPPSDNLPTLAERQQVLADSASFQAAVAALGLPACDGVARAGPPALCWQGFAPGESSALAARVLDDLAALALSLPAPPLTPNGSTSVIAEPPWCDAPYPGLDALTEQEAPIFFGREAECDRLVARLREPHPRCCAIVGRSGNGKSSLVRAGVWPRLARLFPDWQLLRVRPAASGPEGPFASLAEALAAHPGFARRHLRADRLAPALREPDGLADLLERQLFGRRDPPTAALFLFIDQFEELF